jgi:hypothetical protein
MANNLQQFLTPKGKPGGEKVTFNTDDKGKVIRTRSWIVDESVPDPLSTLPSLMAGNYPAPDMRGLPPQMIAQLGDQQAATTADVMRGAQMLMGQEQEGRQYNASRKDAVFTQGLQQATYDKSLKDTAFEQAMSTKEHERALSEDDFNRKIRINEYNLSSADKSFQHKLATQQFALLLAQDKREELRWNDGKVARDAQTSELLLKNRAFAKEFEWLTRAIGEPESGKEPIGTAKQIDERLNALLNSLTHVPSVDKDTLKMEVYKRDSAKFALEINESLAKTVERIKDSKLSEDAVLGHVEYYHTYADGEYFYDSKVPSGTWFGPKTKLERRKLPVHKSTGKQITLELIRDAIGKDPDTTFDTLIERMRNSPDYVWEDQQASKTAEKE